MTTVITRLYSDKQSARGVRERLYREGFPRHALSLISPDDGGSAAELQGKIERALVPDQAAEVYAARVAEGASLVVARATYKPLNAVRVANETYNSSGAIDSGLAEEAFKIQTPPDHSPSVLKDHPRFFTMPPSRDHVGGPLSDQFGFRLVSAQKRRDSVLHDGKRFFGDGIIRNRKSNSVLRNGGFMSKYFWPMPMLSRKRRGLSVIPGGGQPFSRLLGWPTIS
ncbi:MAG: hypothetical protein LJE62_16605 [Silicimonas sp.]|jgi:hypothetical protein|nr:hypothetical protein [Silicimonas sp.]